MAPPSAVAQRPGALPRWQQRAGAAAPARGCSPQRAAQRLAPRARRARAAARGWSHQRAAQRSAPRAPRHCCAVTQSYCPPPEWEKGWGAPWVAVVLLPALADMPNTGGILHGTPPHQERAQQQETAQALWQPPLFPEECAWNATLEPQTSVFSDTIEYTSVARSRECCG